MWDELDLAFTIWIFWVFCCNLRFVDSWNILWHIQISMRHSWGFSTNNSYVVSRRWIFFIELILYKLRDTANVDAPDHLFLIVHIFNGNDVIVVTSLVLDTVDNVVFVIATGYLSLVYEGV